MFKHPRVSCKTFKVITGGKNVFIYFTQIFTSRLQDCYPRQNIDGRLISKFSVLSYNEIVDETSDQAFGRLTTTLLSGGALDLETAVFLYGMGETGGECFPSSLLATGGSLKCT